MRRLLGYVVPYRWTALAAIVLIVLSSLLQLVGPLATAVALDLFIRPFDGEVETLSAVSRWVADEMVRRGIEVEPAVGLGVVSLIYLGSLLLTFLVLYWQGYIMQLMGQRIMFDLRQDIFGRLQRLPVAYFDRNVTWCCWWGSSPSSSGSTGDLPSSPLRSCRCSCC
jgi:ATP-binding cassette subfamily B protein